MSFLFCTADKVGQESGGGLVTHHESYALRQLADSEGTAFRSLSRPDLESDHPEPWKWDHTALCRLLDGNEDYPKLAHFYSGSFPHTAFQLKIGKTKICWTIAAHDKEISREEHERMGWSFAYPHLTDPGLWSRYIDGYRNADVIICPGTVPAQTVRIYGPEFKTKRIEIIPHGCTLPEKVEPYPERFAVGYMGAIGPDKGLIYLLQAWKKLNYKDAILYLAGPSWREGNTFNLTPVAKWLLDTYGGGNIEVLGWVPKVDIFYNAISLYVQPSATEGFGLEVLEAMAHGRPALCSDAAGAVDLVPLGCRVRSRDVDALVNKIHQAKQHGREQSPEEWQNSVKLYTWDKIRQRYIDVWRSML